MEGEEELKVLSFTRYTKKQLEFDTEVELFRKFQMVDYWVRSQNQNA